MSDEPKNLLSSLHSDTLRDLYVKDHPEQRKAKVAKKALLGSIAENIEHTGARNLLANLKREELKALAEKAEVQFRETDNKESKAVLSKKLGERIDAEGINDFLAEHGSEDVLIAIAESLDLETAGEKKEDLVAKIGSAVRRIGLESYFGSFEVDLLHDVAEDLKIKTHKSNNKRKLVDAIVSRKDLEKEPKAKKAKIEVGKKKPIEKGQTYQGIFQHYYANEVREYCKDKGLKTSGNKDEMIKRILAYFEGDESGKAGVKGAKKGRRKGKKGAKKGAKKVAAKKDKEENGEEKK